MPTKIDPRNWNIVVGVALLAAGCGSRVIGQDGGETGGPETGADTGPACDGGDGCPFGYACEAGVCEYWGWQDGSNPEYGYECNYDWECSGNDECFEGACQEPPSPPPPCEDLGSVLPVSVGEEVLALQFVDADGDGRAEVAAATASQWHVYFDLGQPPMVTPREPAGAEIVDMVAGDFDGIPGEDLLLLIDNSLVLQSSNGDGSFAPGVATPVGLMGADGLLAGNFDGQVPTDVLVWGSGGALVERGGDSVVLTNDVVDVVAAFDIDAPTPGFALQSMGRLNLYLLDGTSIENATPVSSQPIVLTAFSSGAEARYATATEVEGDKRVHTFSGDTGLSAGGWDIQGIPQRLLAGDLDGDGADDLVFRRDSWLAVQYDPLGPGNCWFVVPFGIGGVEGHVALGDYDGDGDEELVASDGPINFSFFDGG